MNFNRALIIPTYRPHFVKCIKFLESCKKYEYGKYIPKFFITSNKAEEIELNILLKEFEFVTVLNIEDILLCLGISGEVVLGFNIENGISKFSYQSVKKIYGALYLCKFKGIDQLLILDSESLVFKRVNFNDIFLDYFSDPKIYYSEIHDPLLQEVNDDSLSLLGNIDNDISFIRTSWNFEAQSWFLEKQILIDFFTYCEKINGEPLILSISKKNRVFEIITYHWFIMITLKNYPHYKFKKIEELVFDYFDKEKANRYLSTYRNAPNGIIEFFLNGVTQENFKDIIKMINAERLYFVRVEKNFQCLSDSGIEIGYKVLSQDTLKLVVCSEDGAEILNKVATVNTVNKKGKKL